MKVFCDLHHTSLYNSLRILFEDRLGFELYRPVGLEWWEKKLWNVYDHPHTAAQYLSLDQRYTPVDGSPPLNQIEDVKPDHYEIVDPEYGYLQKAVTLEQFMDMEIDIVIASLPQHIEPYQKLAQQKGAKFIFQVGNQWDGIHTTNIMASAHLAGVPEDINYVEYHQEFNLDLFKPTDTARSNTIRSFMNIPDQFPDYNTLLDIEKAMPDWDIQIHGGMGRDQPIHGAILLSEAIKNSRFIWHVKAGGDGYGHVLFNAAACGVPLIVKKSYYAGKLGEKLLIDGVTCIDIDGLSKSEITEHIRYWSEPARYADMCAEIYENFKKEVDFDLDEQKIKQFLEGLR